MPPSWRYITSAGSRISSLKGYITNHESSSRWRSGRTTPSSSNLNTDPQREERQSWRAWAGQKIRVRKRGPYGPNDSNELVNVFPGWAVRRYAAEGPGGDGPRPFELEVFVSGYAISYRSPENASRSQRAFIRLAKGFASLPKIVESTADVPQNSTSFARLTPSTEALLAQVKLPPRPIDIRDDYDIDALERQLRRAKKLEDRNDDDDAASISSSPSPVSSTDDLSATQTEAPGPTQFIAEHTPDVIRRLHANLERRLQPFWSSVLPNRTIRLHLFATPHQDPRNGGVSGKDTELSLDPEYAPLASQDVLTAADGSFQVKLKINWEELCHHPKALHIAFGEALVEHELMIIAQILPLQSTSPPPQIDNPTTPIPLTSLTRIPITYSPIRVISDIDDTIKFSGILSGARAVFKNVFVNDLRENVIPGMGEWYAAMWSRGVRFHYVSNGPFELLPVLNEFFELSQMPPGSIKLRSYAGRSLFNGLLSAPAARKRAGVVDVLDSFPESRFFLIGDSGEQDLELYADLARERPDRILAVFIRDADANTFEGPPPLEDPTGWKEMGAAGTRPADHPLASRSESSGSNVSASSPSSYSKFNFFTSANSVPAVPTVGSEETPRPNSFSFSSSSSNVKHLPASSLDDKTLTSAKTSQQNLYFGPSKLSAEPEPVGNSNGNITGSASVPQGLNATPSGPAIFVNSPTTTPSPSPRAPNNRTFVDQPPKPTPPPTIRNNSSNLGPDTAAAAAASISMSLRSQRSGTGSTSTSSTSSLSLGRKAGTIVESERKRNELQARVYRARTQMPSHIPLRVFREAVECVEAQEILDRESEQSES